MAVKTRQRYSEDFKKQVVLEVICGKLSKEAAKRKYALKGNTQVLKWLRIYGQSGLCSLPLTHNSYPIMATKKDVSEQEQLALKAKIKQLEQRLEDESLLRQMYSRMIDIAEQEYKIPIRKKPNTK